MTIVLHWRNRLISARLVEDWLGARRKLALMCGLAVLIALDRLWRELLRNRAIRLSSTLVLIISQVLRLAKGLVQLLIWLGWSQWLLISRKRCRLLSRNLVLELLLRSGSLHEALCRLQSLLKADQSRVVFRRRLRRIRERPIVRRGHGIANVLCRGGDKAGLGTGLETGRELSRRK
jgi:hypothetical protein